MKTLLKFLNCRNGNFAVGTALIAVPLLAAAGIAITFSQRFLQESELQQELDAAVLAGTTPGYSAQENNRLAIAYSMIGYNPSTFLPASDAEVSIGVTKTFGINGTSVSGTTEANMPNLFSGFLSKDFLKITVTAKAAKRESDPVCLLALNPSEARSVEVYGNASLDADECSIMANSSNGEGIKQYGSKSFVHAAEIGVTGSFSGNNLTPVPTTDVEPFNDPLASLPVPNPGPCVDAAGKLAKVEVTLEPGTYCGGLNISPQSKITLAPGIFIMKDGPFSLGAGSMVQGSEVMIALIGENSIIDVSANSIVKLTSPKDGTYANIQFMSDRELEGKFKGEEWTTISSSQFEFDGVMYLPEQDLWFKGGSQIKANSPTYSLIGDQFWVQDTSDVRITTNNPRGLELAGGRSGFKYGARLVQ
jgi:hypothetical protein